ncbi:MAG: hypothetical protein ACKOQ2_13595 [Dolichospermum sp.]
MRSFANAIAAINKSFCFDYSNLQKYPIKKSEEVKLPRMSKINQLSYCL